MPPVHMKLKIITNKIFNRNPKEHAERNVWKIGLQLKGKLCWWCQKYAKLFQKYRKLLLI